MIEKLQGGLFILLWLLFCAIVLTVALLFIIRADNE